MQRCCFQAHRKLYLALASPPVSITTSCIYVSLVILSCFFREAACIAAAASAVPLTLRAQWCTVLPPA